MLKIIKFSIILILLINIFSIGILTANADESVQTQPTGLLPTESGNANCPIDPATGNPIKNCGNYSLNDMTSVAVKIANLILSIVGSLSLLAFVAGGLMMMLSAGNPEWVTRGKQTLIGAVIGLAIVFTSYAIIQLVFTSLGIDAAKEGAWSTSNWFKTK